MGIFCDPSDSADTPQGTTQLLRPFGPRFSPPLQTAHFVRLIDPVRAGGEPARSTGYCSAVGRVRGYALILCVHCRGRPSGTTRLVGCTALGAVCTGATWLFAWGGGRCNVPCVLTSLGSQQQALPVPCAAHVLAFLFRYRYQPLSSPPRSPPTFPPPTAATPSPASSSTCSCAPWSSTLPPYYSTYGCSTISRRPRALCRRPFIGPVHVP